MNRETNKMQRVVMAAVAGGLLAAAATACVRVKVDPIHITMDVNVRMEKELDSFFGDIDAAAAKKAAPPPAAAAGPTPQPAGKG